MIRYADMQPGVYGYRACGFAVRSDQAFCSGLLFSCPIPLFIGCRFHGFADISCHRV